MFGDVRFICMGGTPQVDIKNWFWAKVDTIFCSQTIFRFSKIFCVQTLVSFSKIFSFQTISCFSKIFCFQPIFCFFPKYSVFRQFSVFPKYSVLRKFSVFPKYSVFRQFSVFPKCSVFREWKPLPNTCLANLATCYRQVFLWNRFLNLKIFSFSIWIVTCVWLQHMCACLTYLATYV